MEIEVRFYYSNNSKEKILDYLNQFKEFSYGGRYHETTSQYNHPMKEYDFYSKEIDGRFRIRKTIGETDSKCMITWKRRLKSEELIHSEEEVEVSINPGEFDNLIFLLENVLHLELVESYERYRNVFHNEEVEIVVDEYPFGICIEIENKSKTDDPTKVIMKYLELLKLDINDAYKLSWDDKYAELCKSQNKKVESIVTFGKDMPQETKMFL